MNRRQLIQSILAITASSALPMPQSAWATPPPPQQRKYPWKNWSGNQQCYPAKRVSPANIGELQTLISTTPGRIKTAGSGHSFSALVPTDETLLSVRRLSGLKSVNKSKQTATFYAGTILSEMGPLLDKNNQAMINMPDIDQQTLAGAICTATHGTGRELNSLSHYVEGIDIITASGDMLHCSRDKNPELFKASQVSLGALGVITSITMKNTTPFRLKRESQWVPIEETIANAEQLSKKNRNFEFFYFPFTGMTLTDTLNITDKDINHNKEIDGNDGVMDLKHARDFLSWSSKLRELVLKSYMKTISPEIIIDHSYDIYASERNVRFNEMEYHLPAEFGLKALQEAREVIESTFPEVFFPIECRFIKGDDAWLSPFYQRDCISIAVHRFFEEDFKPLFQAIEPIFQKYQGRPHWGKLNTFTHDQFKNAYPKWKDFHAIRKEYDPNGKFLNPYLMEIFGLS